MLLRQFYHRASCSFSYLLADRPGGQALLIDPVRKGLRTYRGAVAQLGLELLFAIDTHSHHDRPSALAELRAQGDCPVLAGEHARCEADAYLAEGEHLKIGALSLYLLHTPGHTADGYTLLAGDLAFTGDSLLVRSVGRTDLLGGDPAALHESLHGKLMRLPDTTTVCPAHDFRGWTASSIDEERWHNPWLQIDGEAAFVAAMQARQFADHLMTDESPLPD